MKRAGFFIVVYILFHVSAATRAQTPMLRTHNLLKGKEAYTVNTIYQDPRGWIWFGTDHGLFRFDGINYSWFTSADSLASNNVTSLCLTEDEVLWIGHSNGEMTLFDGVGFNRFRPESGLGRIQITDIVCDSSGVVWYSTKGEGIFRWDGKYLSNLNTDDGISDDYIYDIEIDRQGVIWLATDNGITKLSNNTCETISMKDGLSDNIVRVLRTAPDGRLWIGTEDRGISIYNPADRSIINLGGWNSGPVTGLTVSLEDEIWISTEKDTIVQLKLLGSSELRYRKIKISPDTVPLRINTVIKDKEENIWAGGEKFITQVIPPVFEFLNRSNSTPFDMCYSLTFDKSGNLWVCSERGLFRGRPSKSGIFSWTNFNQKLSSERINFISLYTDSKGYIWTGTYGIGVFRINPRDLSYTHFTVAEGLSDNNVISISGDTEKVWFSTLGGGISYFDYKASAIKPFDNPELEGSYIYSTRSDRSGRLWVAGSLRYPTYIRDDSLISINRGIQRIPQLYSIAVDSAGGVWFNTQDKGLIRVEGDSLEVVDRMKGISFDKIESIVFDRLNNLLVISNKGILFYRPGQGTILEFGENSGLSYQYPILNSVYTHPDGPIWIGTETGIIKYNPDYLQFINKKPGIFLSVKNSFYMPIRKGKEKFKYRDNSFTFGFTGIWFSNPEGLRYRYMLKGNDLNWTKTNRSQTRDYSNLPAGKYTFIAEVSLDDINWHSTPESNYTFVINPPFWRRWWFITAVVAAILIAVYSYIRFRLRKLERDKKLLEEEVHKRTQEIRKQNRILEDQKLEIARQRDLAEEQRDKIEAQKEEIQSSIRYAHRIQSAALPPKKLLDSILREYFILYKPCDIVSGDFYWVARSNNYIFFAAGDCTGHGVPGSFMSMLGLSALNDIVKSLKTCKASAVLDQLRERVLESLHQGGEREMVAHDGMDISLCILETDTNRLQYAGAHNPIYIIRNSSIMLIPADKIEIGSSQFEKTDFTNHDLQCEPGDTIYLFTDGFADQFGGPKRKKYKYSKFKEFLLTIHENSMEEQRLALDKEIEAWKGNNEQTDDILVMGIRIPDIVGKR